MGIERIACVSLPAMATVVACAPAPPVPEAAPPASGPSASAAPSLSPRIAGPLATPSATARSSVVTPKEAVKDALTALAPRVVDEAHIGRRLLFTWTSRAQAEAIAAGGRALTLVESKTYGPSAFDFMLEEEMQRGNALARLLFHTGFAKKRFAWPNAYATALGTTGGRYGTALLAVELSRDALLLDFGRKQLFDVENREVPVSELTAHPERLAAVYWSSSAGFREYVLVNEAAIARVSSATEATDALATAESSDLGLVRAALRKLLIGDEKELLEQFSKTLAFASTSTRDSIDRIGVDARDFIPDRLTFSVAPNVRFELGGSRGRLSRAACKLEGGRRAHRRDYSFGGGQYCVPSERCQVVAGRCEAIRRPQWFNDSQSQ